MGARRVMTDGFSLVCPACGQAADLSAGLTPNEYGQLICASCGGEIPIPVAAPADSLGDTTTASPGDLPTVVDAQHMVHPAGDGSIESMLRDCGSGRYDEQGTIGKGGMGEIVLCVEQNTRREVAMKRMLPTAAGHAKHRARFVEEAQVTAQLEHPNIVPVHELGRDEQGAIYFTMKLVKGRSLAEILTASRDGEESHSLGEMLQMFLKVCDGVAFAHSRGVVHRDLKPANIMVGDFGEVLVMDWGIARILGRDEAVDEDTVQSNRQDASLPALNTMAGAIMGSPSYMPPEQAAGEIDKIDHRSDIYSLGAILYTILTLKCPVEGADARAILDTVITGDIDAPERRTPGREIPRELSAVAMKCLARFRGKRYQSVPDLQRDVSLYLEGRSVSAAPDTFARTLVKLVKRNKPVSVSVAAAAVILIAVVSVAFVRVTGAMQRAITGERQAVTERQAAQKARDKQRAAALAASRELSERAVRAARHERWVEAGISVAAAQKMLPDGPWGHYAAGMVAKERGDLKMARAELKKALACDLGHAPSRTALSQIAALERRLIEAEELLVDPGKSKDWRAFRDAGDTFVSQQRYRDSETMYARALELFAQRQQVAEKLKNPEAVRRGLEDKKSNATAWVKCEGFYESIKDLGAKEQIERIQAKLKDIHGGNISFGYDIEDGVLVGIGLSGQPATKSVYLQALAHLPLTKLSLYKSRVRDLKPLKGMPLKSLNCFDTPVRDLTPLKGMPLESLSVARCRGVNDLGPLKGMRLQHMNCENTGVSDFGPLKGMPLKSLSCRSTHVRGLLPLKGMQLTGLNLEYCGSLVSLKGLEGMPLTKLKLKNCGALRGDLSVLKGMKLTSLDIGGCSSLTSLKGIEGMALRGLDVSATKVTDLTPLTGMKLETFVFQPRKITKGIEIIRGMKSIRQIATGMYSPRVKSEEFWKKYDAGKK